MARQQQQEALPAGESTSQLPRPHGISSYDSGLRLRHANSAPLENNSLIPTYSGGASSYYPDSMHGHNTTAPLTPLDIQRMENESGQRQYQLIPDQDYLRQRADAMSQVESNIVELGTIFNKLAVMVNEHRDLVQRVEDNVEDANANVNLSLATLTDTLRDLQTNRALGMKVMGILVLFIIMFIIFFA
jgi:syntaxin 5